MDADRADVFLRGDLTESYLHATATTSSQKIPSSYSIYEKN